MGTRLAGKWFLDALLGYGGSAAVYAATHRNGKRAAVKVLHPHCVSDEQLRTRFVREGYVANKIEHPGAVSVLDDDITPDGTPYLVMELLEGTSLERRGRGELPPMTLAEVLRIGDDLLDVLAKAHAVGVVHRDIKPANLFVTHEGQLKVLDFGIARLANSFSSQEGVTQTGLMMGTPAFMPPEQARARWNEVDARSDLWAVGATLLALLLGRRPRIAETSNEELLLAMTAPMPPASELVPNIPPALAEVIDRAVAFQREDRWPNAAAMQQALRAAAATIDVNAHGSVTITHAGQRVTPPEPAAVINTTVLAPLTSPMQSHPPSNSWQQRPFGSPLAFTTSTPSSNIDLEPAPSLTTSRAVLHSSPPSFTGAKKSSSAPLIAVLASVLIVGLVAAGALFLRTRSMHSSTAAATSVTPATPTAVATTPPQAAEPPAEASQLPSPPPTGSAASSPVASTSAVSGAAKPKAAPATTATQGAAQAQAKPASSANPAKFFDSRFDK